MVVNNKFKHYVLLFVLFNILLISCITFITVATISMYSYGDFQLYLKQNGSIGIQHDNMYLKIILLSISDLNCSTYIRHYSANGVLGFTANTNGEIRILTDIGKVQLSLNQQLINVNGDYTFTFYTNDTIRISWRFVDTTINAIIGLSGIILFCANPIIAYEFSDKFRDKYRFVLIIMGLGVTSLGLILTFVYSGA